MQLNKMNLTNEGNMNVERVKGKYKFYLMGTKMGGKQPIRHVSGSRYMARLHATGANWGLDTTIPF